MELDELDAIERRSSAATPGPWRAMVEGRDHMSGDSFIMTGGTGARGEDIYVSAGSAPAQDADLEFIAAARHDIPRLIAEVRRLMAPQPPMTDTKDFSDLIREMETHWDLPDGFFYRLRQGDYDPHGAKKVEQTLKSFVVNDETLLPRRLVSLTWWIPLFMEWQRDRVKDAGGDNAALDGDIMRLRSMLDSVLGVP
jgi:hypothetical protein